jgi:5-methylcytosine-specific restriction endonuclease McrA
MNLRRNEGMLKMVRLKGVKLKQLNDAVFLRDSHMCIYCGRWVEEGSKAHHEPQGSQKEDIIEKMVVLCYDCHSQRHFGKQSELVRLACEEYLALKYEQLSSVQ